MTPLYGPVYATARIVLRPYQTQDFLVWAEAQKRTGRKRNRWDGGPLPPEKYTFIEFKKRIASFRLKAKRDELYIYGIFNKKNGEHLGRIDILTIHRPKVQWANLGYMIHNHHWGNGYATEAARLAGKIALTDLGFHRIEAGINPSNRASIRVVEKIGMRYEGIRKNFFPEASRWEDMKIYAKVASSILSP